MSGWLVNALLALLLWGIATFVPKLALQQISPHSVLIYQVIGTCLTCLILVYFMDVKLDTGSYSGAFYGLLTGGATIAGSLFYILALKRGPVSVVSTVAALYPMVTIFLAYIILQEPITIKKACGMLTALATIILFTL